MWVNVTILILTFWILFIILHSACLSFCMILRVSDILHNYICVKALLRLSCYIVYFLSYIGMVANMQ